MDKNSIQVLQEDLTAEFHALAQTHTTAIGTLLEEFTDDQVLLAIEMDDFERKRLQEEEQEKELEQAQGRETKQEQEKEPEKEKEPKEEDIRQTKEANIQR